jgi:hypothetical protein
LKGVNVARRKQKKQLAVAVRLSLASHILGNLVERRFQYYNEYSIPTARGRFKLPKHGAAHLVFSTRKPPECGGTGD